MDSKKWYCKDCKCFLEDEDVTFFEKCVYCGEDVEVKDIDGSGSK